MLTCQCETRKITEKDRKNKEEMNGQTTAVNFEHRTDVTRNGRTVSFVKGIDDNHYTLMCSYYSDNRPAHKTYLSVPYVDLLDEEEVDALVDLFLSYEKNSILDKMSRSVSFFKR